jgi:hypothetical protein
MNSAPDAADTMAAASLRQAVASASVECEATSARAIVIAVHPGRSLFAVQAPDGRCAVFCQHAGPTVRAGDLLSGPVIARGARILEHADGLCSAVGDTGPISREQALALVGGIQAGILGW